MKEAADCWTFGYTNANTVGQPAILNFCLAVTRSHSLGECFSRSPDLHFFVRLLFQKV